MTDSTIQIAFNSPSLAQGVRRGLLNSCNEDGASIALPQRWACEALPPPEGDSRRDRADDPSGDPLGDQVVNDGIIYGI